MKEEKEFFKIEILHNEQGKYLVLINEKQNVFTTFAEFDDLESAEKFIDLVTNILAMKDIDFYVEVHKETTNFFSVQIAQD
jgi:hypothetical protein